MAAVEFRQNGVCGLAALGTSLLYTTGARGPGYRRRLAEGSRTAEGLDDAEYQLRSVWDLCHRASGVEAGRAEPVLPQVSFGF